MMPDSAEIMRMLTDPTSQIFSEFRTPEQFPMSS